MYGWLWRKLPGPTAVKLVEVLVLFVAVVALLFLVVYPWLSTVLPIDNVTVSPQTPQSTTVGPKHLPAVFASSLTS